MRRNSDLMFLRYVKNKAKENNDGIIFKITYLTLACMHVPLRPRM